MRLGSLRIVFAMLIAQCAAISASAQSPSIALDSAVSGIVGVAPESVVEFAMLGVPVAPFAVLASPASVARPTPFGILEPDALHADANVVFDGFDPNHPLASSSFLGIEGLFSVAMLPFPEAGVVRDPDYWIQALSVDPSVPAGLALTNVVRLRLLAPPPSVSVIHPNIAPAGGTVVAFGSQIPVAGSPLAASVGGVAADVTRTAQGRLDVTLGAGARSGPLRIDTASGASSDDPDRLASWITVIPGPVFTPTTAPSVVTFPCAIRGWHSRFSPRRFAVALAPGDELVAELYVFDPVNERVTGDMNPSVPHFDPFLKVLRGTQAPVVVLVDDDSGPSVAARVGGSGAPRYTSPEGETVIVEVNSYNSQSEGHYLLVLAARPAEEAEAAIHSVHPNVGRPGDRLTVFGSGFDPASPLSFGVTVGGVPCRVDAVHANRIAFFLPESATSGPVAIHRNGTSRTGPPDDVATWVTVVPFDTTWVAETPGPTPLVPGIAYRGAIDFIADVDDYDVFLQEGSVLSLEVYAYDPVGDRIIDSTLFATGPADVEWRLYDPQNLFFPLVTQLNDGPGLNAVTGRTSIHPGFPAPWTGVFRIRVGTFFGWSVGDYLMIPRVD